MNEIEILVKRYPELLVAKDDILKAYKVLRDCYRCGGKLLIAGNGGSAADAEHIVGELMKGFKLSRKLCSDFADRLVEEKEDRKRLEENTVAKREDNVHLLDRH